MLIEIILLFIEKKNSTGGDKYLQKSMSAD